MNQPELGQRILELRKQKGLTQEELVALCNINVRTLQRIESGEVSPRSYTVKTILSALDYDFESLQEPSFIDAETRLTVPENAANSIANLLTLCWIAGIFFIVVAVFEGINDYVRFDDDEFIFGVWGHVFIKALVILTNGLLFFGFLIAGNVLKNHLLKIASFLMMFALLCFYVFDILSAFYSNLDVELVFLAGSLGFGVVGIVFGIALLKARKQLGPIALASGITELIMAGCMLSVVLSPLTFFLLIPAIILEVLVLYKVYGLVKGQPTV